jgi:hypothetical protein
VGAEKDKKAEIELNNNRTFCKPGEYKYPASGS